MRTIRVGDRVTVPTNDGPVNGAVLVRRWGRIEVWIPEWRRTGWWDVRDARHVVASNVAA